MNTTSLNGIYNFRTISHRIGTSGQPTVKQLTSIREAGFEGIINLALPTSDNALPDEGSLVTGLGMFYVHIPVNFEAPSRQDFHAFCGVMDAMKERRVFVHCAANMRVSAFMFLYRVLKEKTARSDAESDMHAIWQPDEVWSRFIRDELANSPSRS